MISRLKILYIAYPLLPLSDEIAGGAEQVLLTVAREVSARGHDVTIAAADGSIVPGRLLATGKASSRIDDFERRKGEHEAVILEHLLQHEYDLVHDMSGSFWQKAGPVTTPMLGTLHLPPEFYPTNAFSKVPPDLRFNGVSHSQASRFREKAGMKRFEIVNNGVDIEGFPFSDIKRNYLLWLGRICEEKAPHLACEVAEELGIPLVLAGQVYPFSYHQQYFDRELRPWLASNNIVFVNSMTRMRKLDLLRKARALLVTSSAEETSSMVAMEAMACGTPVIALRHGALPEVVRDSVTGFIADNIEGMLESIEHIDAIMPLACREHVVRRFSAVRMVNEYMNLYRELAFEEIKETVTLCREPLPPAA